MSYIPKTEQLNLSNLYQDFTETLKQLNTQETGETLDIIDFSTEVINLGENFNLTDAQKLILKLSYGLSLSENDQKILDSWRNEQITTWSPKKISPPQVIVIEAGRRCLVGSTNIKTYNGYITFDQLDKFYFHNRTDEVAVADIDLVIKRNNEYTTATQLYRYKVSETVKIIGKNFTLEGTATHKILVEGKGWTKLQDLIIGDRIIKTQDSFEIPESIEVTHIIKVHHPFKTFVYDLHVPDENYYVANGIISHNSGKTTSCSIIAVYEFYCLCMLNNPQEHYGLATSTPIEILILATTATQAKTSIFRQVAMLIKTSPYFNKLIEQGLLFVGKEEIAYEQKGIYIKSGNSKSSSQVGGTIKCMIMDEVARFADTNGVSNAMELWSNLGISCAPFKDKAKRIAISSAWEEEDAIYQLYQSTINSPHSIAFKFKSWDLNTNISRDNPIVAYEYDRDPISAALEFEGIRPSVQNCFLDASSIDRAVTCESVIGAQSLISDNLIKLNIFYCESRQERDTVVHIDPAVKKDSYALAFGHAEFNEDNLLIVIIDGLLVWEPTYNNEVCMSDVGEKIKYINQIRPILSVTADHYNSAETIQRLKTDGIPSEIVYFSNKQQFQMYSALRSLLHENRIKLPKDSPWTALLIRELKRVQMLKDRKIDHPPNESKDLADAVAAVAFKLSQKVLSFNSSRQQIDKKIVLPKTTPTYSNQDYVSIAKGQLAKRRQWSKNVLRRY
jgi:hypothetical protein